MQEFYLTLEKWYAQHGRKNLPWRDIDDPYRIWISEIILQQTRVVQGMDYYLRFIERFPDVFSLAAADEDEVLRLWQGLGYYSRARNLHAAAKSIAAAGSFPTTYEGVRRLKGIGDYTAAAICSFAFHQPYPVVDGNVYRVLSRVFGMTTPIDSPRGKKEFTALAEQLLDREHPHIYNSAIMDFGATQCIPKSPDCAVCPYAATCQALLSGRVEELPVKAKKTAVTDRFFVYVYIEDPAQFLLRRRPEGDIWQGLYEPFLMEFATAPSEEEVRQRLLAAFTGAASPAAPQGKQGRPVLSGTSSRQADQKAVSEIVSQGGQSELTIPETFSSEAGQREPVVTGLLPQEAGQEDVSEMFSSEAGQRVPVVTGLLPQEAGQEDVSEMFSSEAGQEDQRAQVASARKFQTDLNDPAVFRPVVKGLKHLLTHRKLWIDCYRLTLDRLPDLEGYQAVAKTSRDHYATSKIVTTLFSHIDASEEPSLF